MILTPQAAKELEESFELTSRAWELLDLIVAEWKSDPVSVACFDKRLVDLAIKTVARRNELKAKNPLIQ